MCLGIVGLDWCSLFEWFGSINCFGLVCVCMCRFLRWVDYCCFIGCCLDIVCCGLLFSCLLVGNFVRLELV